ncbi:DUF502 domain-containing protein [Chloroflexota bacterium]
MPSEIVESTWRKIMRTIRKHFLAGVFITIPLAASFWVLNWVFVNVDDMLQPVIQLIFGRKIVGVGFGVTVVLVYIIGVIASNIFGRRILSFGESIVTSVPLLRQLYRGFKQVSDSISGYPGKKAAFREVVLVEFPREGMKTIAFITNDIEDESGNKLYAIFIPTAPIPTSGYFEIVTEDKITRTNLTIDEALRMIMSSGMVSPAKINISGVDDNR